MLETVGDTLRVRFDRFDLAAYDLFLRCKGLPEYELDFDSDREIYLLSAPARFARILGVNNGPTGTRLIDLAPHLWDYQRDVTRNAFESRRYAVWADCGMGKTAIFLEWARLVIEATGGRVVIFSPLQIVEQTIEMAQGWYGEGLPIERIKGRVALAKWCRGAGGGLAITNYEKMIAGQVPELRYLAGVVLDESSILKTGGGKIKWHLIHSCKGIEYKLSCTATPAPNDTMEYASQASFLEKLRNEGEILWTYFQRDKNGEWRIKPHAQDAFYRFMAGWSIYLRSPARYGYRDNAVAIPEPIVTEHAVEATEEQGRLAMETAMLETGDMFANERMGIAQRNRLSQMAKGFIYEGKGRRVRRVASNKPGFVAELIRQETAAGRQVLVWTVFDAEADLICEALGAAGGDAEVLHGRVPQKARQAIIERFRRGQTGVLISKARMLGYGLNFQNCGAMIFSGWNDSYEQFYQALRRAYRYGQREQLRVHIPVVPMLEGKILENIKAKHAQYERDAATMEANYIRASQELSAA